MGGANSRHAAEGQRHLFPPWTVGRQLGRLDATRVPKGEGAPCLPFCAARATPCAGNPLAPVAGRPAGFGFAFDLAALDATGFPAPAAWGAGAMPPGWLPVRGRTSGRLGPPAPTGSPRPSIDRAGARCDSGGSGQLCPCLTPGQRLGVAFLRR